jgi:hypothetical protein
MMTPVSLYSWMGRGDDGRDHEDVNQGAGELVQEDLELADLFFFGQLVGAVLPQAL